MAKPLHEIIAVAGDRTKTYDRAITDRYQILSKSVLLNGQTRTYSPKDAEGDVLPAEIQNVQVTVTDTLKEIQEAFAGLFDLTATRDYGNQIAVANVAIDGVVLIENAPATYLLWLEKQLTHIHTIVSKLPILDPSATWEWSDASRTYETPVTVANKTKKVKKVLVKAEATDKHPAQTEVYDDDIVVGTWETKRFSGAITATEAKEMLDRVDAVRDAVKVARTQANQTEVEQQHVSDRLLGYIFNATV